MSISHRMLTRHHASPQQPLFPEARLIRAPAILGALCFAVLAFAPFRCERRAAFPTQMRCHCCSLAVAAPHCQHLLVHLEWKLLTRMVVVGSFVWRFCSSSACCRCICSICVAKPFCVSCRANVASLSSISSSRHLDCALL